MIKEYTNSFKILAATQKNEQSRRRDALSTLWWTGTGSPQSTSSGCRGESEARGGYFLQESGKGGDTVQFVVYFD